MIVIYNHSHFYGVQHITIKFPINKSQYKATPSPGELVLIMRLSGAVLRCLAMGFTMVKTMGLI